MKEAKARGWLCYHTKDSRKSEAGFMDVTMARVTASDAVLLTTELKTEKGKLSAAQLTWRELMEEIERRGRVIYRAWRPSDWPSIVEALK